MMPASVLYVEDDANDAFFMQRAFERLNHGDALRIVRDGPEALRVLESRSESDPPALLLLDVKLPSCRGIDILQWVRSRPEFAATALAMMTSSAQMTDVELAAQHGANAYLVKPSNARTLEGIISPLLDFCESGAAAGARLPVAGNRLP